MSFDWVGPGVLSSGFLISWVFTILWLVWDKTPSVVLCEGGLCQAQKLEFNLYFSSHYFTPEYIPLWCPAQYIHRCRCRSLTRFIENAPKANRKKTVAKFPLPMKPSFCDGNSAPGPPLATPLLLIHKREFSKAVYKRETLWREKHIVFFLILSQKHCMFLRCFCFEYN